MRILLFNYKPFVLDKKEENGVLYNLLQEYSNRSELQVVLVTPSIDEQQHLFQLGNNISIHMLPVDKKTNTQSAKSMLRYAWNTYKFSKELVKAEDEYSFTHSFSIFPCGLISFLLKRKFGLPYIISLEETDIPSKNNVFFAAHKFVRKIVKKTWHNAYFLIANSQRVARLAMETEPGKEVDVIHENGLTVRDFYSDEDITNPDYFTIVCVSKITPQKGIRFLVQAFKTISSRWQQARLVIVGDGDERISLEQLVQGLEIKDRVFFAGNILHENISGYYHRANVFVNPSLEDKMSKTVLEALACGLPIITTGTEMMKEIIAENENYVLVKKKDSNDLAEKIEKFLLNHNFGKEMGKRNIQLAPRFDWRVVVDEYVDFYLKIKKY